MRWRWRCWRWLTGRSRPGYARSRFGARLMAVRENEDAARALGVDVVRTKTAGAGPVRRRSPRSAACVYAQTYLYIDPSIAFGVERSVEMLLVAMIGGAGTVLGPVLGAIVLHVIADTRRTLIDLPGFAPMLYGVVLLADHRFPARRHHRVARASAPCLRSAICRSASAACRR